MLPCLLCDEEFSLQEDTTAGEKKENVDGKMEEEAENREKQDGQDKLLRHLLLKHSFVIADVHMIADFYKYIRLVFKTVQLFLWTIMSVFLPNLEKPPWKRKTL